MVSKQSPKNLQKYFLLILEYFRILEIKKLPGSVPWWAQDSPGLPGVPRWVVPTWDTSRTPFFYHIHVLEDKKV